MDLRPLNIFQRVMRIWEESHPYNAAQIMQVAGEADVGRIAAAWNAALENLGLGAVRVAGGRFCYEKAAWQEVAVVDEAEGLEEYITREMNRPFDEAGRERGRFAESTVMPFRPFVLAGESGNFLGVIYAHWVADSVALRMLMREWYCRAFDPGRASGEALHVPRGGFWRYFGPGRGGWNLAEGAAGLVESTMQFSNARRIADAQTPQPVACSVHRLPEGMIGPLLAAARRRRMTLNDLFLAALARACDAHGAEPRRSHRDLALGTIVDLRATSAENLENTFGMFLGFTALVVPAEHLRDRDRLLVRIAAENVQQKERRAAQASLLRMAMGYTQGRFLSQERLAAFYRDYMPLSGGVSNVNMNRAWAADYHPGRVLDYIRVAPTGPMVPVVIAVTTIGRRFTFVLTRRTALVDAARGAALARAFEEELTAWAKTG